MPGNEESETPSAAIERAVDESQTRGEPHGYPKPKPPARAFSIDELNQSLNLFVTQAMTFPDTPQMVMRFAKSQPRDLVIATVLHGMPAQWHQAIRDFAETLDDDQIRMVAMLSAVAFVQGAGMRAAAAKPNGR